MVNYLKKSCFKFDKIRVFLGGLILSAIFLVIILNIILAAGKNKLIHYIEKQASLKVSLGQAIYLPPNFFIFKNITFQFINPSIHNPGISVSAMVTRFSWLKILAKKQLFFSNVYFNKLNLDYKEIELKQAIALVRSLPKQDINLFIKGLRLDLSKEDGRAGCLMGDLVLKIKGDLILGSGLINKILASYFPKENSLRYEFNALWLQSGIFVEKFELKNNNCYAQLSGEYNGGAFQFSGHAFMNTFPAGRLPRANLFLLDINSQGDFVFPKLRIKQLNFLLNNNPFKLKGEVSFLDPVLLDLHISSSLRSLATEASKDVKIIGLKIKSMVGADTCNSSGELEFESLKKRNDKSALEKFSLDFSNLKLNFSGYPNLKINLDNVKLDYRIRENQYSLALDDLSAVYYSQKAKLRFIEFSAPFYEGTMKGGGWVDTVHWPPRLTSAIALRNVNAHKLEGLLINFSKIFGRLDSQMHFSSFPRFTLKGASIIRNGCLVNFDFFKWLADFLNLTSLSRIDFNRAAMKFLVNAEGANLYQIYLYSKDVNLGGYFRLANNDRVSSKISILFSRQLLEESNKLTPLLDLLGKDFESLAFDFQLSGNFQKINFKWLDSEFKRKIHSSIPDFVERSIDQSVDKAIESLALKESN